MLSAYPSSIHNRAVTLHIKIALECYASLPDMKVAALFFILGVIFLDIPSITQLDKWDIQTPYPYLKNGIQRRKE